MNDICEKLYQVISALKDIHRRVREYDTELDQTTLHRAEHLLQQFMYEVESLASKKQ